MRRATLVLAALVLAGCAGTEADLLANDAPLIAGTPDAVGVVRLVNDPSTTFAVLDDDVPLDRRAAEGLVAGRPFDDIDAIDAVPYVGPVALERLYAFAAAAGFVPEGDDRLGVFDGIPFSVDEADRALDAVNDLSAGVLQYEVGLDGRAVDSIASARPILSMPELADLYWVGPAMLTRIKDYTEPPDGPMSCRSSGECPGDEQCVGKPFDGSSEYGVCRDLSPIEGEGDYCNTAIPCGDGLFCGGITLWGEGTCRPLWMSDTFVSETQRYIPLDTPHPVATSVTVRGQASVPEDIVVHVEIGHPAPRELIMALRDPNGAETVFWSGPSETGDFPSTFTIAGGPISRDEPVNGYWMVRIWNAGGTEVGNLYGWTLDITSRWD